MRRMKIIFKWFVIYCLLAGSVSVTAMEEADTGGFRVLDISERTFEGGPAIAVLLSAPLDPKTRHDDSIRISNPQELLKSAWVLSDDRRTLYFPHVEPETKYSVTVLETLASARGTRLSKRVSKSVTTRKIKPIVSFATEGMILPKQMNDGLPVVTVNIDAVEIDFFKLRDHSLSKFVSWRNITGKKGYYQLKNAKKYGDLVFSGRFTLNALRNKRTVCHIPVEEIEPLDQPGVFMAVMREPGEYDYSYETTYFIVTDIALHARVYDSESIVFASSLKTANPLPDVEIVVFDNKGNPAGEAVTDENGRCRFSGKLTKMSFIKADYQGQTGILPMRIPALDMSDFDLGERPQKPREIFAFSPRDLYRPGETVVVSALLRDYDGRPVKSLPLKAVLYRPDGKEVKTFTWYSERIESGGLNYYQTELKIPKDAQTGLWRLNLKSDPSSGSPVSEFRFHVEEFLPERMKLDLSSSAPYVSPANSILVDVSGTYLYGAPASGNKLSARVAVAAKRTFDAWKGFQFGDIRDKSYSDSFELPEAELDKFGSASIEVKSRWKKIRSPLSVSVITSLFEKGGRPVVRRIEQTMRPAEELVGVRPLFDEKSVEAGPVEFEIVKTGPENNPVPAPGLMVEIIKEDRDYYWEYTESSGWNYKYSEKNYRYLTDTLSLDGKKPQNYTVQLENGIYVLQVRDPETDLVSSVRFYVGYWGYGDNEGTTARPDKVVLKPDRPSYRPGDLIRLDIIPPHPGNAIVLVEGQEPLWLKRVNTTAEGITVEIPVSAGWDSHDLYISAIVLRPGDSAEKITPNRSVGLVHIPLDRSAREILLKMNTPEKIAPNEPVTANLKIESEHRKSVYVTLAAVDVGILNITDFKTPDPHGWFFEQRRYGALAYDYYGKVIENMEGGRASLKFGGDADIMGGKRPDTEVRLVSLFQGPVAFNEKGEASVTFDIPDFNGKLRFMALVFNENSFGSAETEVTVAAPVVTQLAMPRFMAPGDHSELTLDVHNLSGTDQSFSVSMCTEGPLTLENGERTIDLADGEKTSLGFPVAAENRFEGADIKLHLQGETVSFERNWRLGIRPGYPGVVRRFRQVLNQGETFRAEQSAISDLMTNTVSTGLTVSTVLSMNLDEVMEGLISYPYGCLEQTASRAFPIVYATPDRIRKFNLPEISRDERVERVDKSLSKLSTMQTASGGFALWSGGGPEQQWLTVYVTDFLLNARDMGFGVPSEMLDKAMSRVERYLKQNLPEDIAYHTRNRDHVSFAVKSYAAYVLSRVNRAPLGTLRTLWDNHSSESESGLPLAHMAVALKQMGDVRRSAEAFKAAAVKRCPKYGYWRDYSSLLRDMAWTLSLMIDSDAHQTEGFDALMLDLEDELRHRKWFSTQEKFAVFKAGLSFNRLAGDAWKGRLIVGNETTEIDTTGERYIRLTPEMIESGVEFVSETEGMLFASMTVGGYTKTPPAEDHSQIDIRRELLDLEGNAVGVDVFHVGRLLLVHLMVNAEEWLPDAMVVDFLPAGFEIENQNLKHGVKLSDVFSGDVSIERLKERSGIVHEEFRDDRYVAVLGLEKNSTNHLLYLVRVVSPGMFVFPPPLAESMYRPEIRGVGKTPNPISVLNRKE